MIAALALAGIYLLSLPKSGGEDSITSTSGTSKEEVYSPKTALESSSSSTTNIIMSRNKEQLDEEDVDPLKITLGTVTYDDESNTNLPYYHCGPLPTTTDNNPNLKELILLHGASGTKEDWKTSGILDMLCDTNNEDDEGNLSILALDLSVMADGIQLGLAFDALVSNGMLSGKPCTFISPSASGKAIVSLGEMAATASSSLLTKMIKAWIPVASFAVLSASDTTLFQYKHANIPILAIHGDQDSGGKRVTERLQSVANAKGVELEGGHRVYMQSPEKFVQEVMQFLDEEGL